MGYRNENTIVLGSLRYKSASNVDSSLKIPFIQSFKENIEYDRTIDVNLAQVYDDERQASSIFRPTGKISLFFKNSYVGKVIYPPFANSLYYVNVNKLIENICTSSSNIVYSGYPSSFEFDFMRTDYEINGYTQVDDLNKVHIDFIQRSATTYNWGVYLSYGYDNDYSQAMEAYDINSRQTLNWVVSDGIPFVISRNLPGLITFRCMVNHGLKVGEYVKLSFNYNNQDLFEVSSLGNGYYNSDLTIFNIRDVGFTGNTFNNDVTGTIRRVIDINNPNDTISTYYVRRNKILTNDTDAVIAKVAFEQTVYNKKKQVNNSTYTPNKQNGVSYKEDNLVYSLSFDKDIDISKLVDNQKRPITELYYTIIWKGFFGWTMGLGPMKKGYSFNIRPSNTIGNIPSPWWSIDNVKSNTNLGILTYNKPGVTKPFSYVKPPLIGDVVDGDYCEWNSFEQLERVISPMYHKITFNPYHFNIGNPVGPSFGKNQLGYYYVPHHMLKIGDYSDYIEEGDKKNIVGIPDWAIYSTTNNVFRWRDKYSYGYIDEKGNGVNFPFFNGVHYPYSDIIFSLIPEGTNYIDNNLVATPLIDDCE